MRQRLQPRFSFVLWIVQWIPSQFRRCTTSARRGMLSWERLNLRGLRILKQLFQRLTDPDTRWEFLGRPLMGLKAALWLTTRAINSVIKNSVGRWWLYNIINVLCRKAHRLIVDHCSLRPTTSFVSLPGYSLIHDRTLHIAGGSGMLRTLAFAESRPKTYPQTLYLVGRWACLHAHIAESVLSKWSLRSCTNCTGE